MGTSDRPRLWPAFVACAVAAAAAVVVAVLAARASNGNQRGAAPPAPMTVVAVWPQGPRVVRAVTRVGGCLQPVAADVARRDGVVAVRVLGATTGGGCEAVTSYRCSELVLDRSVGRRRLLPHPGPTGKWEQRFARGPCPRVPVR
jgi:hypothetical protein